MALGLYTKVRQRFRWGLADLRHRLGAGGSLLRNRPGGRILLYHGIDLAGQTHLNSRFTSRKAFEAQLAYFRAHFHVVDLAAFCAGERHPERLTVALTFDDGYRNNLTLALPLLEAYGIPATFCITGIRALGGDMLWADALDLARHLCEGSLLVAGERFEQDARRIWRDGQGRALKDRCKSAGPDFLLALTEACRSCADFEGRTDLRGYWELMDEADLRALAASPLVALGAHGLSHASLDALDAGERRRELEGSRDWLQGVTQAEVSVFAYPSGAYSPEIVREAADLGFAQQLLMEFRLGEAGEGGPCFERMGVNPHISHWNQLGDILRGSYL